MLSLEPKEGPKLTERDFHQKSGWIRTEEKAKAMKLRLDDNSLRNLLGFKDLDAMKEVQENAIRILDICNDPTDGGSNWGENRKGLVYGMVQSGKTANMLNLIALSMRAGYRLFIILSGDKDSLRKQTQERVNRAFNLDGGLNSSGKTGNKQTFPCKIHSPTYLSDYKSIPGTNYNANLKVNERLLSNPVEEWSTILVIKKEASHLQSLIDQINQFRSEMANLKPEMTMSKLFPTLIIDDEADYASLNYKKKDRTKINKLLIELRNTLDHNCFAAYTATPQGCLIAAKDPVGYPEHFWWMIEPSYDIVDGRRKNRSYLGVWEVFKSSFSRDLLHPIGDDEWPHHDKDESEGWKSEGIRIPEGRGGVPPASHGRAGDLFQIEEDFLDSIIEGERDAPASLRKALIDHIITCGVRWWRNWNDTGESLTPTVDYIERNDDYKFHSMMVHLSLKRTSHKRIRTVIQGLWEGVKQDFESFDPGSSPRPSIHGSLEETGGEDQIPDIGSHRATMGNHQRIHERMYQNHREADNRPRNDVDLPRRSMGLHPQQREEGQGGQGNEARLQQRWRLGVKGEEGGNSRGR